MAHEILTAAASVESEQKDDYAALVERVHRLAESWVPEGSIVAIVTKGDSDLLRLDGRTAWHFPRTQTGVYAGHHPADDSDAIQRLEAVRADGARFLLLPATASWWLDHYAGFKRHLDARYERIADDAGTGVLYSLAGASEASGGPVETHVEPLLRNIRSIAAALLPAGTRVLVASGGDDRFLDLGGPIGIHLWEAAGADLGATLAEGRARGAEYLLIPQTSDAWLDRHAGLRDQVEASCSLVTRQENVCTIYGIAADTAPRRRKAAVPRKPATRRPRRKHG